jgi:glutamate-1-semialdehyde 2,1-aminomutase
MGFLQGLREVTKNDGALLIFDEVMTGFRVHPGGAQTLYNIKPDLTTLGKVIGGGLPVGAYGGRRDIMDMMAPSGPVYQAGTLSGNPLAMTAGIETLTELNAPGVWESLESTAGELTEGLAAAAAEAKIGVQLGHVGTMFGLFFNEEPVTNWESAANCDGMRFKKYHNGMLEQGVYVAPSQYEAGFLSTAHGSTEIANTVAAAQSVFSTL